MSEAFSTWADLEAHLVTLSDEHLERDEGEVVQFAFSHADDKFAVFFIHRKLSNGNSWVLIAVRLARVVRFDLAELMAAATREPAGAVALADNYVSVTHNLPVRGLRADHLEQTIRALCDACKTYRALKKPKKSGDGSMFAHLVDD